MARSYTGTNSTEMIPDIALGRSAYKEVVGPDESSIESKFAVAIVSKMGSPQPTGFCLVDFRPKPFFWSKLGLHLKPILSGDAGRVARNYAAPPIIAGAMCL